MEYEAFLSYIKESIGAIIGTERTVNLHKIVKNNDVELDALTIIGGGVNISPTIYLNDYYEEYLKGREPGEIVYDIYGIYEAHKSNFSFDIDFFSDFDKVKNKILYKLINYDSNQKLLSDVPHIRYLDLAIVFYCLISNDTLGNATTLIHTSHMDMWNVTTDDLMHYASINTPLLQPSTLTSMADIVREILISDIQTSLMKSSDYDDAEDSIDIIADQIVKELEDNSPTNMYVLTNKERFYGATTLLYSDVLKAFASEVNSDLYILPSSIHEIIIIPYEDEISVDALNDMVNEVNAKEVDDIEILSNHSYIYRRDEDKIFEN